MAGGGRRRVRPIAAVPLAQPRGSRPASLMEVGGHTGTFVGCCKSTLTESDTMACMLRYALSERGNASGVENGSKLLI